MTGVVLVPEGLARLMPMHILAAPSGMIRSAGPTLGKILGTDPAGRHLSELVRLRRPDRPATPAVLAEHAGAPLRVELARPRPQRLTGVAAGTADGGAVLNLSFGIGLRDAVSDWSLTMDDFAPTDLAAELLYLVEANAAALAEARRLAERLDAAHEAARREAETDALTGLANRRALERTVDRLVAADLPFALLSIDLDRFKAVNDTWGHEAGDAVLRAVAKRMRGAARREDLSARLGGDEFTLLLRGEAEAPRLLEIAEGLIRAIEAPIALPPGSTGAEGVAAMARLSASIGIVRAAAHARPDLAALLRAADAPLYRAKRAGRGRAMTGPD